MSTVDHIFLRTGLPPAETAQRIADALSMSLAERRGRTIVSAELPDQPGVVGGDIDVNVYGNDPEERSVLDGYDTAWAIRSTVNDEALVHREAAAIFSRLVDNLPWPALLVRNHARLVSAWNPQLGRRDMPDGVTPEAKDEPHWAPYALPPA